MSLPSGLPLGMPSGAIPYGCYLKVKRSLQHLETLNNTTQEFFSEREAGLTFRLHGQTNSHRTKQLFRAELLEPLPLDEWGIIVGDAIHCLRSALDQMVYAVAESPTRVCAFPIFNSEKDWTIESPGMLWSVPEAVRTVIHSTQPYIRGNAAQSHPLALLRHLSNLDKHRGIPTAALVPMQLEWGITETRGIKSCGDLRLKTGTALENDAVLAELPIEPDESGVEPYVNMKLHFTFDVAFGWQQMPSALYSKSIHQTFYNDLIPYVLDVLRTADEELAATT